MRTDVSLPPNKSWYLEFRLNGLPLYKVGADWSVNGNGPQSTQHIKNFEPSITPPSPIHLLNPSVLPMFF
jgi:hypothetical protein